MGITAVMISIICAIGQSLAAKSLMPSPLWNEDAFSGRGISCSYKSVVKLITVQMDCTESKVVSPYISLSITILKNVSNISCMS
jgi:hypothetical protein